MRRFLITEEFNLKVEKFCDKLFTSVRRATFIQPQTGLKRLRAEYFAAGATAKRKYVREIIKRYSQLKKAKPSSFQEHIDHFEGIIAPEDFDRDFAKEITDALRFDRLRDKEYPNFIKDLQINACVYCNAMLTIVLDLEHDPVDNTIVTSRKNQFEIDHNFPASKYPYLSTTFYNLYPSCSNCNRSKLAEKVHFYFYTEQADDIDVFEFSIPEEDVTQYQIDQDIKKVRVNFGSLKKDDNLIRNHNKYFRTDKIYQQRTDLLEELLQKSMAYDKAGREDLVAAFNDLFPDETMIKRLIIANYPTKEDVHKRPFAKFTQDIAKQLGLI